MGIRYTTNCPHHRYFDPLTGRCSRCEQREREIREFLSKVKGAYENSWLGKLI